MASVHLLRPVGSSQFACNSSSSEGRTASRAGFQRRSERCLPPASLDSRQDHRPRFSVSSKFLASSSRPDAISLIQGNLSQTADVEQKVYASQVHVAEPLHVRASAVSIGSSPNSGPATSSPPSMDRSSAYVVEYEEPSTPGKMIASSEQSNGSGTSRHSQMQIGSMPRSQPVESTWYGGARSDLQSNPHEKSMIYSAQYDEMGQIESMEAPSMGEFYSAKSGDLVLGVVTHANDLELTVEIGSRVPAVIAMREFQPITEARPNSFFQLPPDNDSHETVEGFVMPSVGKVMLLGSQAAYEGAEPGESMRTGTIVVAEVLKSALGQSRPFLTCRKLAERLTFLRIEQIMKTGEPIKIEITQYNDGGLQGSFEGLRAFLPKSELLARPENTAALRDYVGKTLTVSIVKVEHHLSNIIVSEIKHWMSENVLLGSVHDLLVTKLFPYGLQVEILDTRVRGFIHIKSISRGFVMSVYTFFTEGDVIKGMVVQGKKPGQLSFSIGPLEPPDEDGLVLKERERVYDGAEEVAKNSPEYQLPLEERRIFARPSSATRISFQENIANLPWLHLEKFRNSS